MKRFALPLLLVFSLVLPAGGAEEPSPAAIAGRLQLLYEETTSLSTSFHQITTLQLRSGRQKEATGTMRIKKPGKMRWDYQEPEKQTIVCDGTTLTLYTEKNHQMVTGSAAEYLKSDVTYSFFAGTGDILKDFDVLAPDDGMVARPEGDTVKLIPKNPHPQVDTLLVTIDRATALIKRLEITDHFGSVTTFLFTDIRRNADIAEDSFTFTPPAGTEIIRHEQ
ncbi:MAG: outer membrane lipoprotein carrier protein LolA [Thermodesulfobacteriota bacterium]